MKAKPAYIVIGTGEFSLCEFPPLFPKIIKGEYIKCGHLTHAAARKTAALCKSLGYKVSVVSGHCPCETA